MYNFYNMGKRHHYLPQFWVKQYFGKDNDFYEGKNRINIKNHRYGNHLYSLDEKDEKFMIEEYFSKVENVFAQAMRDRNEILTIFDFFIYEKWGVDLRNRSPRVIGTKDALYKHGKGDSINALLSMIDLDKTKIQNAGDTWVYSSITSNNAMIKYMEENSDYFLKRRYVILNFPIDMPLPNESTIDIKTYIKKKNLGSEGVELTDEKMQITLINCRKWFLTYMEDYYTINSKKVDGEHLDTMEVIEYKVDYDFALELSWSICEREHINSSAYQMKKKSHKISFNNGDTQRLGTLISMHQNPFLIFESDKLINWVNDIKSKGNFIVLPQTDSNIENWWKKISEVTNDMK